MFVSVNRRNDEAQAYTAMWARASLFRRFTDTNAYRELVPLKYGKLAHKISVDILISLQCSPVLFCFQSQSRSLHKNERNK